MAKIKYHVNDLYVVHPDWKLRNDEKFIVAGYYGKSGAGNVKLLSPVEGLVISLLNGTRTCGDIENICTAFFISDDPNAINEKAVLILESVISLHVEPFREKANPLLVKKSELSDEDLLRVKDYNPSEYLVKAENFTPNNSRLKVPSSILFLLTNRCQTDCQYCYMPRVIKADEEMPWTRMKELVIEAKKLGVMCINISGGDPLCYPHIFELLDLLEELEFEPIELPTKSYVSFEKARRLANYKVINLVQFSIDSTVPEIADFMVQRNGFYDSTMESIRNSIKAGLKIQTKSVITPYNLPTIPKLYRDLKKEDVSPIVLATYCRSGYSHKDKLYNYVDDYEWLDEQINKLKKEFPDDDIYYQNGPPEPVALPLETQIEMWPKRNFCTAGRYSIAVCANGKVVACEQCPENEEDYLGDLMTQSIEEVWGGKTLNDYLLDPPMEKFVGTVCYECDEFDDCQKKIGSCVRESCKVYGTRWAPAPNCPKAPPCYRER